MDVITMEKTAYKELIRKIQRLRTCIKKRTQTECGGRNMVR